MSKTQHLAILALSSVTLLLSACAKDGRTRPSCPVPDGISCISTLEVYERTNTHDDLTSSYAASEAGSAPVTLPGAVGVHHQTWGTRVDGDTIALDSTPQRPLGHVSAASGFVNVPESEPFRVPAKVMRIYVRAWQDEQGDLHTPGFIFTEIEPRKWSVGLPTDEATSGSFFLLEALGSQAAQEARAGASATAPSGRPVRPGTNPDFSNPELRRGNRQ